jgi:hypothetical protein
MKSSTKDKIKDGFREAKGKVKEKAGKASRLDCAPSLKKKGHFGRNEILRAHRKEAQGVGAELGLFSNG